MNNHIIAIEGNIGTGKSTLLAPLMESLNKKNTNEKPWKTIYEEVETDPEFKRLLEAFTNDPSRRVEFQKYITERRSSLLKNLDDSYNYIIERSLFSDVIFAQCSMMSFTRPDGKDVDYYHNIISKLDEYPQIATIIYLKSDPKISHNRMQRRGRKEEDGTPLEYLELLSGMHDVLLPPLARKYKADLITHDWTHFGCVDILADRIINESLSHW